MSKISESLRLLGLIVTTKPFTYVNNVVSCNYESYKTIEELSELKKQIQKEYDSLPAEAKTDELWKEVSSDVDFLKRVIDRLEE